MKYFCLSKMHKLPENAPHQWLSGNAQNWQTGGVRFKPRSRLSTYPFGVFRSFLRNSRNYGLRSLRKTYMEGNPPIFPGPTSGQLDSYLHPTYLMKTYIHSKKRKTKCFFSVRQKLAEIFSFNI